MMGLKKKRKILESRYCARAKLNERTRQRRMKRQKIIKELALFGMRDGGIRSSAGYRMQPGNKKGRKQNTRMPVTVCRRI